MKIIGLQTIRGIAALGVLLFHYTCRYNEVVGCVEWPFICSWGCYAVVIFFFISGFLTSFNIVNNDSSWGFIKKRINRLYPTFWGAMIITFFVTSVFHFYNVSFFDFLANFSMLPMVFGMKAVDGVYWTQQHEIFFYLLVVVILYYKNRVYTNILMLLWGVMSVIIFFFQDSWNTYILKAIRVFLQPEYAPVFISGLSLGLLKNKTIHFIWFLFVQVVALVAFSLWANIIQFLFLLLSIGFVTAVVYCPNFFFNKETWITKPFVSIATISYPLYLVHQKIGFLILYQIIFNIGYDSEIIIVVPITVSIVLAYFLHKYIEQNSKIRLFK